MYEKDHKKVGPIERIRKEPIYFGWSPNKYTTVQNVLRQTYVFAMLTEFKGLPN
jgi:hypothetical protein